MSIATRARTESVSPLYFELPFPPSLNNLFVNGKRGRFTSPKYKAWKDAAGLIANAQAKGRCIAGYYALDVKLVRPDKRRRDASNYLKAVEDLLVSLGITDDDCENQFVSAQWVEKGPACFVAVRPCTRWAVAA